MGLQEAVGTYVQSSPTLIVLLLMVQKQFSIFNLKTVHFVISDVSKLISGVLLIKNFQEEIS